MSKKISFIIFLVISFSFAFQLTIKVSAENDVDPGSAVYSGTKYANGRYYTKSYAVNGEFWVRNFNVPPGYQCGIQFNYKDSAGGNANSHYFLVNGLDYTPTDIKCTFNENMQFFYENNGATHALVIACLTDSTGACLSGQTGTFIGDIVVDRTAPTTHVINAEAQPGGGVKLISSFAENYPDVPGGSLTYYYRWNGGSWTAGGTGQVNQQKFISLPYNYGTYDFYSIGTDGVGNQEAKAATVEASGYFGAAPTNTPAPQNPSTPTSTPIPANQTTAPKATGNPSKSIVPTEELVLDSDGNAILPSTTANPLETDIPTAGQSNNQVQTNNNNWILVIAGMLLAVIAGIIVIVYLKKRPKKKGLVKLDKASFETVKKEE